mgnify:CR=1 FL=1
MCVEINEKEWIESPLIGVSESPISGEEDYQLILNSIDVQLRTSEHRSMYSYVRLSIDRCTATYV